MEREEASPIQNLAAIDVMAKRDDGTAILVVVCAVYLDGAADTIRRLDAKLDYYLDVLDVPEFYDDIGGGEIYPGRVTFVIRCPDLPDEAVVRHLYKRMPQLGSRGVLELAIHRDDGGKSVLTWSPGAA
jgi:hypothetical protein